MPESKIRLMRKQGLYLKDTVKKGRGVFCRTPIRAGEILEVTPALLLNKKETKHVDETALEDYTFKVGKISKKHGFKNVDDASAVVFGILTFCNHSSNPNAEIIWEEAGRTIYYQLRATKNIPKNTEVCTTYGEGWFKDRE